MLLTGYLRLPCPGANSGQKHAEVRQHGPGLPVLPLTSYTEASARLGFEEAKAVKTALLATRCPCVS